MLHLLYACMYVYLAVCEREREFGGYLVAGFVGCQFQEGWTQSTTFSTRRRLVSLTRKKMNVYFYRCEFYMNRKLFNCDTICGNAKQAPISPPQSLLILWNPWLVYKKRKGNVKIDKLKKWKSSMSCLNRVTKLLRFTTTVQYFLFPTNQTPASK